MELFNQFSKECPQVLANFHSVTQSNFVCHQNLKECNLNEHSLPDYGGSSTTIDYDHSKINTFQLKTNVIGNNPFVSHTCSLPLELKESPLDYEAFNFNANFFQNMIFDPRLKSIIRADYKPCSLTINKIKAFTENDELLEDRLCPAVKFTSSQEPQNGPIQEVGKTFELNNSLMFFVKQPKSLSFLEIEPVNDDQDIACTFKQQHFLSIEDLSLNKLLDINLSPINQFLYISKNPLLSCNIALALNSDVYEKNLAIIDYDLCHRKPIWTVDSNSSFLDCLNFNNPINLICLHNHPKLLSYCESKTCGIFDTRIRAESSFKKIVSREKLNQLREWERFRAFQCLSSNCYQFVIALDHKLILVDSRYPQQSLLQWNHMLHHHNENQIKFLNSDIISSCDDRAFNLITLANNDQVCLLTLHNHNTNIIQPSSLHPPFHISKPDDSWHISSSLNQNTKHRLSSIVITGLTIVPFTNGYTVYQMTNKGDLFFQDFFARSDDHFSQNQEDYCCNKIAFSDNCNINSKYIHYLNQQYDKIETSIEDKVFSNLEREQSCNCCQKSIKIDETDEQNLWTRKSLKKWHKWKKTAISDRKPEAQKVNLKKMFLITCFFLS